MTQRLVVGAVAGVLLSWQVGGRAQETFDVAVVERSAATTPFDVVPGVFLPSGRWSARGATLAILVSSAYALPPDRILGLPAWGRVDRFDVVTTPAPTQPLTRLQSMAQQLLAERFGLRVHFEQRINDVNALVQANAPSLLGPGLRPSAASCDHSKGGTACGEAITSRDGVRRFALRDRRLTDLLLISGARTEFDGPVVDRTGLLGTFDIDLEFVPSTGFERDLPEFGVLLPQAMVDQLGLRVVRRREPVDLLVIDEVVMPSFE